jgi:OHCU decarboxylase
VSGRGLESPDSPAENCLASLQTCAGRAKIGARVYEAMPTLKEINSLSREDFVALFGGVFESSAWVAEKAWASRPFGSEAELYARLCQSVSEADERAKLELIRAHPDLGAHGAIFTDASQSEQASAQLDRLSPIEKRRFDDYNRRYREKFGFPFVICARLNKKNAILSAFPKRLENSPQQEMETALQEIFKIAQLRLNDLVQ